jgi:hypothetical protein
LICHTTGRKHQMKERKTQDSLECNMYGLAIQADLNMTRFMLHTGVLGPGPTHRPRRTPVFP